MTIVIDVNAFSMVFDPTNKLHSEFEPVKEWITEKRKGYFVFGGSKYKDELFKSFHTARLVRLLRDSGRAIEIASDKVDALEKEVRVAVAGTPCNDPHIIALLAVANCPLLCSLDKASYPFVKCKELFPKKSARVKIYSGRRNRDLLGASDRTLIRNIA